MPSSAQVAAAQTANDAVGNGLRALQVSVAKKEAAESTQAQHADDAASQAAQDAEAVQFAAKEIADGLTAVQADQKALDDAMTALSS